MMWAKIHNKIKALIWVSIALTAMPTPVSAVESSYLIPPVAQTVFQDMGYNPRLQAEDMVIVYMDDDLHNLNSHKIREQIALNDTRNRYDRINLDLQKLVGKGNKLPSHESHFSNVTYSSDSSRTRRAVVCQIWGSRDQLFDRLSNQPTLRDIDLLSHEISHCQLSRSASRFDELEGRYPGVYIWTHQRMDNVKAQNPELGKVLEPYVTHVQEVFADLGSVIYIYNNADFTEAEKLAFIAELRDHRRKYDPFEYNSVVTHYTGFYLDYLLKNPELLKDFNESYQDDPVVAVFDLAYLIGKDYSLTLKAFQRRFTFNR